MAQQYTLAEVAKHDKEENLWMVIHDKVYDVTKYLHEHPGGSIIMEAAGKDGTALFEDIGHSSDAREEMKKFYVGDLKK
eukprot:EC716876.1.p1 GENE.EC716876.1~~EC716876.1.p1  ORF type:complete len:79 (+),score=17.26 EC716876.1:86-322(+)